MSSPIHTTLQSCTLPPIRTLFTRTYTCPYFNVGCECKEFASPEDVASHIQTKHAELLSLLLTSSSKGPQSSPGAPSTCGDDFRSCPEFPFAPMAKGWFDPSTARAQATFNFVKDMGREGLHRAFWETNSSRVIYGEQSTFKNISAGDSTSDSEAKLSNRRHREAERKRRRNQADLMHEIGTLTPEIAYRLADVDEQMAEIRPKSTTSKGPGKYDQMISDAYMHNLAPIVVQSEHEGRKVAEARVKELEATIENYERRFGMLNRGTPTTPLGRDRRDSHYDSNASSPTKRQRTLLLGESVSSNWLAQTSRFPPSPEPSPRLSPDISEVSYRI